MFPTRLSQVTADQIQHVIDSEASESIDFELKKALSAPNGAPDPWASGGRIGDQAKNKLAIEMVAFANTSGGILIVGIDEDPQSKSAKPPIYPIRRCQEAAAILHQALTARIEPRLPVFECEGVVTDKDGTSGVIAMRTLESYLAPHRNMSDNRCYIRRNDRAEPMSMVEIQDLARRVGRTNEIVEKAFSTSSETFFDWLPPEIRRTHPYRTVQGTHREEQNRKFYTGHWILRLTAVPLRPLPLGKLPNQPWLQKVKQETFQGTGRQGLLRAYDIDVVRQWVPRLRAVERELKGDWTLLVDRIANDGQAERFYRFQHTVEGTRPAFLNGFEMREVMWNVASVIRMVDIIRASSGRPTQDFALEIEFGCSDAMGMGPYPGPYPPGLKRMPQVQKIMPRYEIGSSENFNELLTTIDRDFWNLAGNHLDWELAVDWPMP
jgi:hypothetical protein